MSRHALMSPGYIPNDTKELDDETVEERADEIFCDDVHSEALLSNWKKGILTTEALISRLEWLSSRADGRAEDQVAEAANEKSDMDEHEMGYGT